MKPKLIDTETQGLVEYAMLKARRDGTTFASELNQLGLLLSPSIEAGIRADAFQWLVNELRGWTPAEFLRRGSHELKNQTPADMYQAIGDWMQEHADAARNQE